MRQKVRLCLCLTTCLLAWGGCESKDADAKEQFNRGVELFNRHDYDAAIACFDQVIKRNGMHVAEAYYNRGLALANRKRFDEAISDFAEATRRGNDSAELYTQRAHCYYNKKDYQAAAAAYTNAIGKNPSSELYFYRANCLYELSEYDKAISDYSEAIRLRPNWGEAYKARGFAKRSKNSKDNGLGAIFTSDDAADDWNMARKLGVKAP